MKLHVLGLRKFIYNRICNTLETTPFLNVYTTMYCQTGNRITHAGISDEKWSFRGETVELCLHV